MKKAIAALCALVLLFSLAACGSGAKPEATVTAFLDAMKAFDLEAMNACTTADWSLTWETDEESQDAFSQQMLDVFKLLAAKIEYTIGETETDGDKATVDVTLQSADAAFLVKDAMTDVMAKMVTALFSGDGEDEMAGVLGETLREKVETADIPLKTTQVAIPLEKGEEGWRITDISDELTNALTGNIVDALSEVTGTLTDLDGAAVE